MADTWDSDKCKIAEKQIYVKYLKFSYGYYDCPGCCNSSYRVEHSHAWIGEPAMAEAMLDRLLPQAIA